MLFYLSFMLKAVLAFSILAKFISGFMVDTSFIVFLSAQIIMLDYVIFKDREMARKNISISFSYLNDIMKYLYIGDVRFDKKFSGGLKTAGKQFSILGFISAATVSSFLCGSIFFFASPLYSQENITIPDLSGLKQFTAETNFMSFEGYIISYFKIKYDREISRGEARKIVKSAFKKKSAYEKISNDEAIAKVNSAKIGADYEEFDKKYSECVIKLRNTIDSIRKINGHMVREGSGACACPNRCSKKSYRIIKLSACQKKAGRVTDKICRIDAKYNVKRVVLLPFKKKANVSGSEEESAFIEAKKTLADKGFSVVSGADIAGVCFNLDNLNKSTVRTLAKKFDANYIITGSIADGADASLKIIDAAANKTFSSFDCLN
ncbi:MAG: hypothetical protein A2008_06260 [Candidatus Wallbacteria bacterium GWC2_49_35]|uniref:Uncharacterized protein n=1 Tax=Candidatus Wallbacteria bacterium GWC2_49_35 TaxID=1817813 RepID=A0A1F7WTS8_9BACT|nr:MAG: hypothetical protein A2008_06260 [Candidatus Wallbacteria bacterium GWC2_49_35]HBC73603.1 hypothetical protein [Candidatus Wallbacteria bacterium]